MGLLTERQACVAAIGGLHGMGSWKYETCAVFYLQSSDADPRAWATELLGGIGARTWVDFFDDLCAEWGGLINEVEIFDIEPYRILALVFSWRHYADLAHTDNAGAETHGAVALANAFRDACEAWRPPIAFISSQQVLDIGDFVREYVDDVRVNNVFSLAQETFGLLYARQFPAHLEGGLLRFHPHDALAVTQGLLIFAGKGPSRWWG